MFHFIYIFLGTRNNRYKLYLLNEYKATVEILFDPFEYTFENMVSTGIQPRLS